MLKDQCTRGQISRLFGSALIAAAIMPLSVSIAIAQAGSVGGTIGKQNKSVSGGEEAPAPRPLPPAPKNSNEGTGSSNEHTKTSLVGSWQWRAQCNDGTNWDAVFVASATGDRTVALNFVGAGGGTGTGIVSGSRVTLLRSFAIFQQTWSATLSSSNRMAGTVTQAGGGRCTFQASR